MAGLDYDALQTELKKKRVCRFCLSMDATKLSNVYLRDTRIRSSAPLPIQIMAIASIEIFSNDGMPSYVCSDCTKIFEFSYQFKQMCKKADNLLRQFPLTGMWPECLDKPILLNTQSLQSIAMGTGKQYNKTTQVRIQAFPKIPNQQDSLLLPKKILNSTVATNSSIKFESNSKKELKDCTITFLDKIENNDELSLDDVHQLIAAEEVNDLKTETFSLNKLPVNSENKNTKPKLLNKSSIRILNKEAVRDSEPRLSLPKINKDVDGKMEIVAEILNVNDTYEDEPDPSKAEPIKTNVFPCPNCERSFPLMQLRDLHLRNHTRDRKFQCEHCDKSFFSKYDLNRHMFLHNGEKPYKCSACEKSFSRSSLLTRHEKTHTDIPTFICVQCERSFISKADMEKHAERHKINRPFVCKICNKAFAFKQGLERHEAVHSRQQPYPCQYCDQSFSTTTKLSRHLTAHAGLRPYPCKYCRKSFLLSHHLIRHMRSHRINDQVNAIKFLCTFCNASFNSREELVRHSSCHANDTSLTCPLCKEVFKDMGTLNAHIKEHSEGDVFACEFCDLIFLTASNLQAHTDIDHTQEMEAYHADDRAQADKQLEMSQKQAMDCTDENLQNAVDEFLHEEFTYEPNKSTEPLKKEIKSEPDNSSPKIIHQIIIQSSEANQIIENQIDDANTLLVPLKQRKIDVSKVKTEIKSPNQTKRSPPLRRKTPNATLKSVTRETKQPEIQSSKLTKNILETKTSATETPMTTTNILAEQTKIKIEANETSAATSSSSTSSVTNDKVKIGNKKVTIQKITVTRAQAAAMAKEGRIKIKDGKMILNTLT